MLKTVHEAEAMALLAQAEDKARPIAGLGGGTLTPVGSSVKLSGYSLGPGVALDGFVTADLRPDHPVGFHGVIHVEGRNGTTGELAVNGDSLDGNLDGVPVVAGRLTAPIPTSSVRPWSTWAPSPGPTAVVTRAIAAHVAPRYLIDATGAKLLAVSNGPPRSKRKADNRPLLAIAVRAAPFSVEAGYRFDLSSRAWTYTLCGRGPNCAISPGTATELRGRLVRREGLELALYTFEFAPGIDSVVVYLPPPRGTGRTSTALYFLRSQLTAQLAKPLDKTLTRATPPFSTEPDPTEARNLDRLTVARLFRFNMTQVLGDPLLYLAPF